MNRQYAYLIPLFALLALSKPALSGEVTCAQKLDPILSSTDFEKLAHADDRVDGIARSTAKNILNDEQIKSSQARFSKKTNLSLYVFTGHLRENTQKIELIVDDFASVVGYRINSETTTVYKCINI